MCKFTDQAPNYTTSIVEVEERLNNARNLDDYVDVAPSLSNDLLWLLNRVKSQATDLLTFQDLMKAGAARVKRWHPDGIEEWSTLEWAGAMAGEAGETCNAAKKLKRLESKIASINADDRTLATIEEAKKQVGLEVADTIIYAFLVAERAGVNIEEAVIKAFNDKSLAYGFPEML